MGMAPVFEILQNFLSSLEMINIRSKFDQDYSGTLKKRAKFFLVSLFELTKTTSW